MLIFRVQRHASLAETVAKNILFVYFGFIVILLAMNFVTAAIYCCVVF